MLLIELLEQHNFDVVILDMNFNGLVNTGNEGIYWLKKIKEIFYGVRCHFNNGIW